MTRKGAASVSGERTDGTMGRSRSTKRQPTRSWVAPEGAGAEVAGDRRDTSGTEVEEEIEVIELVDERVRPSGSKRRRAREDEQGGLGPPVDLFGELTMAVGAQRATRLAGRVEEAAEDFGEERFDDAKALLAPIAKEAPSVAPVRELLGLTLYRLGRFPQAARELEAARQLTGSVDQHPVLADCYRAQRRWGEVERLWLELSDSPMSTAVLSEGRIVAAGALADQGRLGEAIALLEQGWSWPRRAKEHHLRRGYALADLYERAGDVPRARSLFGRITAVEDHGTDADERLDALG